MCSVSAVHQHYQQQWPSINDFLTADPNREALTLLKQALEILKQVDAKLGEPNCVDPKKEQYLKELEEAYEKYRTKND